LLENRTFSIRYESCSAAALTDRLPGQEEVAGAATVRRCGTGGRRLRLRLPP
jgi:hypothetical protein